MSTNQSSDEQPKKSVAKRVVTPKRRYFVPEHDGFDIAADSAEEAVKKAKARNKQRKEGDA